MTDHKTLKRRVRARMSRTGESYTAARRQVLAKAEPPSRSARSDALVADRTGRPWASWLDLLEAWGADDRTHTEIARWLRESHGVSGWWAQELTYRYELASGRREPGQRPDGFQISVSRTLRVPVAEAYAAFLDPARRERWLPGPAMRPRTVTPEKTARFDWEDGSTRLVTYFEAKDGGRSTVTVTHEKLPDARTASDMKAFWRTRLDALRRDLEAQIQA